MSKTLWYGLLMILCCVLLTIGTQAEGTTYTLTLNVIEFTAVDISEDGQLLDGVDELALSLGVARNGEDGRVDMDTVQTIEPTFLTVTEGASFIDVAGLTVRNLEAEEDLLLLLILSESDRVEADNIQSTLDGGCALTAFFFNDRRLCDAAGAFSFFDLLTDDETHIDSEIWRVSPEREVELADTGEVVTIEDAFGEDTDTFRFDYTIEISVRES